MASAVCDVALDVDHAPPGLAQVSEQWRWGEGDVGGQWVDE